MEWRIAQIGDQETIAFSVQALKRYLARMDDETPIALMKFDGFTPAVTGAIWVGLSETFHDRLQQVEDPLSDDAILIEVENGAGIVTGTNARSVLIAVYRLLQEMGCRWIRPGEDGEVIPRTSLSGLHIQVNEKASYRHRGVCIEGASSFDHILRMIDWLPKIGMNGYFIQFMVPFTFFDRWYAHKGNPWMPPQPVSSREVTAMSDFLETEIKKRGMMYHAVGHGWTCEPFGIEGRGWDVKDVRVPEEVKPYLAQVNGKRELHRGIPLDTNLCYSNPEVRRRMATAVVEYCKAHVCVDYLHFWLADGTNNHCECEKCRDTLPSDYYVMLLNEIDERLTQENLQTKLVFLLYADLLWCPQRERLHHPERFTMMFAPITRTYSVPLWDGGPAEKRLTPPYTRNQLAMPRDVRENLAYLSRWQKQFQGDSFDFDYHFFWDHVHDMGGYRMAQVLFEDMKNLDRLGLQGMMSCQVQRAFFPTGLGMAAMAGALWNKEQTFETVVSKYHADVFGALAEQMTTYFKTLSEMFDPPYLRIEREIISEDSARRYDAIPAYIGAVFPVIEAHLASARDACTKTTWLTLRDHAHLCTMLSRSLAKKARGDFAGADEDWEAVKSYANGIEPEVHNPFDVEFFVKVMERSMKTRTPR